MRNPDASWWLKLRRAQEGLRYLDVLLIPCDRTNICDIRHAIEGKAKNHTYRVFAPVEPDPMIPVALGEVLFNLRSALDHIAIALLPKKYRTSAYFPIAMFNPFEPKPTGIDQERYEREVSLWNKFARHTSPEALARLVGVQPYTQPNPDSTWLAALNRLHNADKHRNLVAVVEFLESDGWIETHPGEVDIRRKRFKKQATLVENGTLLGTFDHEVDMYMAGSVVIAIKSATDGTAFTIPHYPYKMLRFIRDEILVPLDDHVRA